MDNLRNFISRLLRSEHAANEAQESDLPLNQLQDNKNNNFKSNDVIDYAKERNVFGNERKKMCADATIFLQSNDIVAKATVTEESESKEFSHKNTVKETNLLKGMKIVKILNKVETKACKNINTNVYKAKKITSTESNDEITCNNNNMNFKITKLSKTEMTDAHCEDLNTHGNRINDNIEGIKDNKIKNRQTIETTFPDLENMLEATSGTKISNKNRYSNLIDTLNFNNSLELRHNNDQTSKCIKEFNKVLAEVQRNNNSVDANALPLEEIDDILLDEDLDIGDDIFDYDFDMDSTYNFQEIKHVISNVDKKDLKFATEENMEVISISSDDSLTIVENDSKALEDIRKYGATEISGIKKGESLLLKNNVKANRLKKTNLCKKLKETKTTKILKKNLIAINFDDNLENKISTQINSLKKVNKSKVTYDTAANKSSEKTKSTEVQKFEVPKSSEATHLDTVTIYSDQNIETTSHKNTKLPKDAKHSKKAKIAQAGKDITNTKSLETINSQNFKSKGAKIPEKTKITDIKYIEDSNNKEDNKGTDDTKGTEDTKGPEDAKGTEDTKCTDETKPNILLDTISISTDEHLQIVKSEKIESDDCGYHSSDFEFISEEEAKKYGIIYNFDLQRQKEQRTKVKSKKNIRNTMQNNPYGPGPSSSRSYSYYRAEKQVIIEETSKENYVVPQENQLVNMFHDTGGAPAPELRFLENKALHTRVPMLVQFEGVGFDLSLAMQQDSGDELYRDEAKDSLNRIMETYPTENARRKLRKRRRR